MVPCNTEKHESEFYPTLLKKRKSKICIECRRHQYRQYYLKRRSFISGIHKEYRRLHKPEAAASARLWRSKNPEKASEACRKSKIKRARINRGASIRREYGISIEEYESLIVFKNGICDICGDLADVPNIDHCHETLIIRGILCGQCNRALGMFKDSERNLQNALDYLKRASDLPAGAWWANVDRP